MPRNLRQAHNRELFRAVNEQIADLTLRFSVETDMHLFICECARLGCSEQIRAPLGVYADVRAVPDAYLVVSGHEDPAGDEIIAGHGDYLIVVAATPAAAEGG